MSQTSDRYPAASDTDRASLMVLIFNEFLTRQPANRHWLTYHFQTPTRFGLQLLRALADCELGLTGLGFGLVSDLAAVPYARGEAGKAGFQKLLQKLAEVVALRVLVTFAWPEGTRIHQEPANPTNGRRPELSVDTGDHLYLFEVKCPSLVDHQWARYRNERQIPGRSRMAESLRVDDLREQTTWPRDNVLKDFLASADEKFSGFASDRTVTGYLIVVWDHSMYEVATPLINNETGLLNPASFHVDDAGERIPFSAVDGVIVLNHLSVLTGGAQETGTQHREDPFVIAYGAGSPNVWYLNVVGKPLPAALLRAFDAVDGRQFATFAADYAPQDMIMWHDRTRPVQKAAARRRKRRLLDSVTTLALHHA